MRFIPAVLAVILIIPTPARADDAPPGMVEAPNLPPSPPPPPRSSSSYRRQRIAGTVVASLSGALLISGGVVTIAAADPPGWEIVTWGTAHCDPEAPCHETLSSLGPALLAVGAIGLITGITTAVLATPPKQRKISVDLAPRRGGATALVTARF